MTSKHKEIVLQAINRAIKYKVRFYAYKLPGANDFVFGAQLIEQQTHIGFMIYPFKVCNDARPAFISMQYDAKAFLKVPNTTMSNFEALRAVENESTQKEDYLETAHNAIAEMKNGRFDKIVMSRVIVKGHSIDDWAKIFSELAEKNPNSFVFMYNSGETGAWLGVTPEQYLSAHGKSVSVMALAATKPYDSERDWTAKEVQEQGFVGDFISEKLQEIGAKFAKSETYNRRAGNVQHICNDFTADNISSTQIEKLKRLLHPTPAISGLPQRDAVEYVMKHEGHKRLYYGGYIGPIYANGDFDFYVNLRSMMFDGSKCCIYSGGGLTAASNADDEWEETELKSRLLSEYV